MSDKANLQQLKLQELKEMCEKEGLPHARLNKAELIKALTEGDRPGQDVSPEVEQARGDESAGASVARDSITDPQHMSAHAQSMEERRMEFELEKLRMPIRLAELENEKRQL